MAVDTVRGNVIVRDANHDDLGRIVCMARRMQRESRYGHRDFSASKVMNTASFLINDPRGIVVVCDYGFIAGGVDEDFFGTDLVATEFALYVEPEHRNTRRAAALISAYVDRAKALGATDVQVENSTGVQTDAVMRLFKSMGFEQVGGKFALPMAATGSGATTGAGDVQDG